MVTVDQLSGEPAGGRADGWSAPIGYLGLDRLGPAVSAVDDSASDAGRDPTTIRKAYNIGGVINSETRVPFRGTVRQWVDQLVELTTRFGMNAFI